MNDTKQPTNTITTRFLNGLNYSNLRLYNTIISMPGQTLTEKMVSYGDINKKQKEIEINLTIQIKMLESKSRQFRNIIFEALCLYNQVKKEIEAKSALDLDELNKIQKLKQLEIDYQEYKKQLFEEFTAI